MSLTELEQEWGEDAAAVASDWLAYRRPSEPCSGMCASSEVASLQPATRSDNGEAVWLLTEKAKGYLFHSQAPLGRKASLGQPCRAQGSEQCEKGGRTSP